MGERSIEERELQTRLLRDEIAELKLEKQIVIERNNETLQREREVYKAKYDELMMAFEKIKMQLQKEKEQKRAIAEILYNETR